MMDADDTGKNGRDPGRRRGTGDVVPLAEIAGPDPDRILSEMRAYWEGLRRGRAIPDRADVEPRGIRRALNHAFILERIAPGAARFRLAGRHLVDLMGMEVRGMPLCAFLNPSSRGRLSDVLETVFKRPQIAELWLAAEAGYGRPALTGRLLLLPLKSDLGDVTRALGCLVATGQSGRAPRRFDLLRDRVSPVIPGAMTLEPAPSSGMQEEPAIWRPAAGTTPRRPARAPTTPEERRALFRLVSRPDER